MIEFYFACFAWSGILYIFISRGTIDLIDVFGGGFLAISMGATSLLAPYLPESIGGDFEAITLTLAGILVFIGPFIVNQFYPVVEMSESETNVQ